MVSELNDHGFADTGSIRKVAMLQDTIWELEGLEPWPFLETSIDLNYDGDSQASINFPANFRAALRLKDLNSGRRVRPMRLDEAKDFQGANEDQTGDPLFYYIEAGVVKVWPAPTPQNARLRLRYLRYSDPISDSSAESDILIPKWHHRVIVLGTLVKLYTMEDDTELAQAFKAQFDEKLVKMRAALWQLQYDQTDVVEATDDDYWDYDYL